MADGAADVPEAPAAAVPAGVEGDGAATEGERAVGPADKAVEVPVNIKVQFRAVGGAPQLKKTKFALPSAESWSTVLGFLGKQLKLEGGERVFAYLRASFAPSPVDHMGTLWRHYRVGDELIIQYATTPAYG